MLAHITHIFWDPARRKWTLLATLLGSTLLLLTLVYATGVLFLPALQAEQWLLNRPLSRLDCVLYKWRLIDELPSSCLLLTALISLSLFLRYRKRVTVLLFALFLGALAIEFAGKLAFAQPVSNELVTGMNALSCQHIHGASTSTRLTATLGLWWLLPESTEEDKQAASKGAQTSLDPAHWSREIAGYPGGHAIRGLLLWGLVAWFAWRHLRNRFLRLLLSALALALGFLGGIFQWYTGSHFLTDTSAGFLLAGTLLCLAIPYLLVEHERRLK